MNLVPVFRNSQSNDLKKGGAFFRLRSTREDSGTTIQQSRTRVVHIVPYEGFGGVETALRSIAAGHHNDIEFHKCFIAKRLPQSGEFVHQGSTRSENNPRNYFDTIRQLLRLRPSIAIASLWRSCIVLLAIKIFRPSTKAVVFLHLPISVHRGDWLCNWLAMQLASEIWTDSEATLAARVPERMKGRAKAISFLTLVTNTKPIRGAEPKLIYWGRIDRQKGLERALRIFAEVRSRMPGATLTMIGFDRGYGQVLRDLCKTLDIGDAVYFMKARPLDEIRDFAEQHSFFLQASEFEGMGVSVIEAMQLGLVPVVTPVGEIARYCVDQVNSIIIGNDSRAAADICDVIRDPDRYRALAEAAEAYWRTKPTYRDDVLEACRSLAASSR